MDTPATEINTETIAPQETVTELPPEQDYTAQLSKLEEEKENYRKAYLKEATKNKADLPEDEKIAALVDERIAQSRLAELAKEQDELIKQMAKENRELKLAQLNKKTEPLAATGTHSEAAPVADTAITSDQLAFFKSQGWDDKKIEAYKKNLAMRK